MAVTSIMIANLETTSTYVDSFIVEVYSDSGLTTLVGSGSCSAVNDSSGDSVQQGPITITGLSWGATYYSRAGVQASVSGLVVWSATETIVVGTSSAPSGVTYAATITPTTSGVNVSVTPASIPSDIQRFEAIWNITGTTPSADDSPTFSGVPDALGNLSFFAGGTPGDTVSVWMRAVNTSGIEQTWSPLGSAVALDPATAVQQSSYTYSADTGTANAYAVTLTPTPTIVAGSVITFQAAHANTGPSTLSVNGGSPLPIRKNGTAPLSAGDIVVGQIVVVVFDATNNVWQMQGALIAGKKEIPSAIAGQPAASQNVLIYTAATNLTFSGNFASPQAYGSVGTNATATAVYTVKKNGSSVGTISISTSGVFTFATTSGAAISLVAGDRFTVTAPAVGDVSLADVGFTLVGTF